MTSTTSSPGVERYRHIVEWTVAAGFVAAVSVDSGHLAFMFAVCGLIGAGMPELLALERSDPLRALTVLIVLYVGSFAWLFVYAEQGPEPGVSSSAEARHSIGPPSDDKPHQGGLFD